MEKIKILDKEFEEFIPEEQIIGAVERIAEELNHDLKDEKVIFMGILNGCFLFVADLIRKITFESQVSFVKLASYEGTSTSGAVEQLIGINEDITNRTVVILEDIIDTGITMEYILKQLSEKRPGKIRVAALLLKPDALQRDIPLHYVGIKVPNAFLVGYGLDYKGLGRNLSSIYKLAGS